MPPDWPPQTRLTQFPLYDERGLSGLALELQKFLDEGPPPIAFTFGSAMWHARELLEQSAPRLHAAGTPGNLVDPARRQPPRATAGRRETFRLRPFQRIAAALLRPRPSRRQSETASQGLAAGVPQVILPHAHDQHDQRGTNRETGCREVDQAEEI